MIKGRPCKVVDVSTSKTGKHGHAKANFVAVDIFNGKKVEDVIPTTHTTQVPIVSTRVHCSLGSLEASLHKEGEAFGDSQALGLTFARLVYATGQA